MAKKAIDFKPTLVNSMERSKASGRWAATASAVAIALVLALPPTNHAAEAKPKLSEGLVLTVRSGTSTDLLHTQGVALFVPAGQPATPFLGPGPLEAVWQGQIVVDLRADVAFHAISSGAVKVEANGSVALETAETKRGMVGGKPIRLNKGPNPLKVTFTSPSQGDSLLRLYWSSDDFSVEPVSPSALRLLPSPELETSNELRLGRELFLDLRCAKCHSLANPVSGVPELQMDAPSFEGIGARRNATWMKQWVTNPSTLRESAQMPVLLHGASASEDAESIAAFLATLTTSEPTESDPAMATPEIIEAGKKHFETFHCVACHMEPGAKPPAQGKLTLGKVNEKFSKGALASFLRSPADHYQWIRMPNFKFTVEESQSLAAYLSSSSDAAPNVTPPGAALAEKGRRLIETTGCLNCHSSKLQNAFKSPSLADIRPDSTRKGCMDVNATATSKSPRFQITQTERSALVAFLNSDRKSLERHVPSEFAARQIRQLNCAECHGKFDGFPTLDALGGKLKPEWSRQFIGGTVNYKPRPWLESRMPAFKAFAEGLGNGLAHLHGFPSESPGEGMVDAEAAKIGQKLVSADGGFSCVSCHGVAAMAPTQVFESAGINLAFSGERLLPEYYKRWLLNPLRMDPQTKMPVYFDQGKSPLSELLEGDASKQIDAMWHYIRLGSKMPPPTPPQAAEPTK